MTIDDQGLDQGTGFAGFEGFKPEIRHGTGNPEALKYGEMWKHEEYRKIAPGEELAAVFLQQARPKSGAEVIDFGCGTGRGAFMLVLPPPVGGNLKVTMLDFVNNSLDEDVRNMLTTQAHVLRFLKRDLEQPIDVAAEYGFCTDVMEHIPPDKVDQVLNNILLSAQHVFFGISTVEDACGALIGKTLHLSVHPFQWWMQKFIERHCLVHWADEAPGVALFYVSAWRDTKEVVEVGTLNVTEEAMLENVRTNVQGGWSQARMHQPSSVEVLLLGGGPSLNEYEDDIRAKWKAGAKIVTMNGTYNWAYERGLWPVTQIMVDAREFNKRFVQPIDRKCIYLISSQCHPAVFEGLPDDRTYIWHTGADDVGKILEAAYSKWSIIPGGTTVLFRAIPLLRMLGFTKFHLYGCDSCLQDDAHHAYAQPENDGAAIFNIKVTGGRMFRCFPWMASQAQQMIDLIRWMGDDIELEVYGDGLLAHMLNTAAAIEDVKDEHGSVVSYESDLEQKSSEEVAKQLALDDRNPLISEVVPGLYVGGLGGVTAALEKQCAILGVRHLKCDADTQWVPILVGNHKQNLNTAAEIIETMLHTGQSVFVHCWAGVERAPLTVAWFLHTRLGMTLDEAYALVKAKHWPTQDRRKWIEGENLQGTLGA